MKENHTHIAFILDRSGSMGCMQEEAIGSFNAFIQKQQSEPGTANLSLILFDHEYLPMCSTIPIEEMPELTRADYVPRGTTALLDAMGRTIDDLGKQLADLPESERPENVIVVTLTDGLENASQDYRHAKVAEMIQHQQECYDWEFLFLGSNLASTHQAEALNIPKDNSVLYASVEEGVDNSSEFISKRRRRNKPKKIGF